MRRFFIALLPLLLGACTQYQVVTRPDPSYRVAVINELTNRLLDVPVTYIDDDGNETAGFVDLQYGMPIVVKTQWK